MLLCSIEFPMGNWFQSPCFQMLILAQLPQLCPWAASYHPLLLAFKGKGVQGSCPAARGVIWYQLWVLFLYDFSCSWRTQHLWTAGRKVNLVMPSQPDPVYHCSNLKVTGRVLGCTRELLWHVRPLYIDFPHGPVEGWSHKEKSIWQAGVVGVKFVLSAHTYLKLKRISVVSICQFDLVLFLIFSFGNANWLERKDTKIQLIKSLLFLQWINLSLCNNLYWSQWLNPFLPVSIRKKFIVRAKLIRVRFWNILQCNYK